MIRTIPNFYSGASALRAHFEDRFSDPRTANADRFVWDYWNVPNQYTLLRTPAYHFFPKKQYEDFHRALVLWGRRNLGCHDISPPWLSSYVHGCEQKLHGDLPHGPWAFVYSLTPWKKRIFTGGETLIMKESMLDYWRNFRPSKGLEENEIFTRVAPEFNQLTLFDPRIPHGVARVDGAHDVLDSRLVVHGWFVQPRPFIEGPISPRELQEKIDSLFKSLGCFFSDHAMHGALSFRLMIRPSGEVSGVRLLMNHVRVLSGGDPDINKGLVKTLQSQLRSWRFKKATKSSQITLPIVFESE